MTQDGKAYDVAFFLFAAACLVYLVIRERAMEREEKQRKRDQARDERELQEETDPWAS